MPPVLQIKDECQVCHIKNVNFESYIKQLLGNISDAAILVSPEKIERIDEAQQKLLQYRLENQYESRGI
jgi:hypothetical protein|tara:strand:+ start:1078 stop:1284 length:207 start_codon:yes stop_codon:yes gene_type:complete